MFKKNISPESHFSFSLIGIITVSRVFMENCLTQQQLQRDVLIRLFTARRKKADVYSGISSNTVGNTVHPQ
jgi:hypothetical protein